MLPAHEEILSIQLVTNNKYARQVRSCAAGFTLALSGADLSEIMDHVGWSRRHTALYYMQLAKVLNPSGASAKTVCVCFPSGERVQAASVSYLVTPRHNRVTP
jgi:hypothetical protein